MTSLVTYWQRAVLVSTVAAVPLAPRTENRTQVAPILSGWVVLVLSNLGGLCLDERTRVVQPSDLCI